MRNSLLIFSLLFLINDAFSHSPSEVSFSIYEGDTFILVDAQFPWALRNAVFMFDSTLNKQSTFKEIKESLFIYISQNLVLLDENNDRIKLLKVIDKKGNSHHEEYQLVFENKPASSIRNSLLFNFSNKQKNFHLVKLNGEQHEFFLTKEHPVFEFKTENSKGYLYLIIGIITLIFAVVFLRKAKVFS